MTENNWLAEQFEAYRTHLRAVAYRMLGSTNEADDAVQEAWLRLSRTDTSGVENLAAWLTTVVGRVCLDMLRTRSSRREEPFAEHGVESIVDRRGQHDPEQDVLLGDSVGIALLVVLETLAPAERVAFVLHDMFAVPFDEIAVIVDRSPDAARQLASRARRRIQGAGPVPSVDLARRRRIVDAFLAASRKGDFAALLSVLDPEVVARADPAAIQMGAAQEIRGAPAVAETFAGRARAAQPALINGAPGLVWLQHGEPRMAFGFTIVGDKIVGINLIADAESLGEFDLQLFRD
jgi:RNA polymerase sigma-70 factor (ECF subfamily)